MTKEQFYTDIARIHSYFETSERKLKTLSEGVHKDGEQRKILDNFLESLGLPKDEESYYAAAVRIGERKFEPLENYLGANGYSGADQDRIFETSFSFTRSYYEKIYSEMLLYIQTENLLTPFYRSILEHTHKLGVFHSDLFLVWNKHLIFGINRELEARFDNDTDVIIQYLEDHNLFDRGHRGEQADRSYSVLLKDGDSYKSVAYSEAFKKEVGVIIEAYTAAIAELQNLEDKIFDKKEAYITYFKALVSAWSESDPNLCVEKWAQVDRAWMYIDTPIQPGHPLEYYDDKYRRAVGIDFDLRLQNPELLDSRVAADIENMYEGMYDEIGRESFEESYEFSKKSFQNVQLYIGAPIMCYGAFMCGAYSAQVVPNDEVVSHEFGKKIFAFPKYVLEAQRVAPKMELDSEVFDEDILKEYREILGKQDSHYYEIYDIETIGHEYGHTLWMKPGAEVTMNASGQFKNIEEFKATAGGLVSHFITGPHDLDRDIVVTHLIRSVKMLKYREVEDIVPYYCECLIHMHIFFESGLVGFEDNTLKLYYSDTNMQAFRELYIAIYTQQIFTYLNTLDARNFLGEFTVSENGVYLPKEQKIREFVEYYYNLYKKMGNKVKA